MVKQLDRNPKWPGSLMRMSIEETVFQSSLPLNFINGFKRHWAEMRSSKPSCVFWMLMLLVMQVINDPLCTYIHLEKNNLKIRQR